MACMEDLFLQKGCLKAYATFCLCGFLKDLIYELIIFAFMYFSCVGFVFFFLGLYLVSWTCILGLWTCMGCLSCSWGLHYTGNISHIYIYIFIYTIYIAPPNYQTDTQLLDRHPTTRQTPNYKTDTQLQDRHPTTRQTPNYKTAPAGFW